jgi:G3E family GTPase
MDLLSLGGFFGAGKTTLLLLLARHFVFERREKIVIVQNEIGKIGVDDQRLLAEGLPTTELLGGCICCQLQNGMVATLRDVAARYNPDLILVEASGMATPPMLRQLFDAAELPFQRRHLWTLFDASRLEKMEKCLSAGFLTASMEGADVLVLNKVDVAPAAVPEKFRAAVTDHHPQGVVVECALREADRLPEIFCAMLEGRPAAPTVARTEEETHEEHHHHHHHPGDATGLPPVICARQQRFAPPLRLGERVLCDMLERLAGDLQARGCVLLGHLKLFAGAGDGRYVSSSVTRFGEQATPHGTGSGEVSISSVTINAIAHGLREEELSAAVDRALDSLNGVAPTNS